MRTYIIALGVIKYKNKYLIGKRSKNKKFSPNKYEFISGFIEEKEPAENTILKELQDETKLNGRIINTSNPYIIQEKDRWITIPFLIESNSEKFIINNEDHSELLWVSKEELEHYSDLKEDLIQLKNRNLI